MKHTIRMYQVFFPRKCFAWLMYILYPLLVVVACTCFLGLSLLTGGFMSLMMSVAGIVTMEYILDVYILCGIATKENKTLEYVKSSAKGVHLLQQALCVDGIRRILTTGLIMTGLYLITKAAFVRDAADGIVYEVDGEVMSHPSVLIYVQCGLMSVLFVELGMLLTRRTKNVLITMVVLYLMSALTCPFSMVAAEYTSIPSVVLTTVVLVILMVISRKILVKKVRESFYDEGYKELHQIT